MNTTKTLRFVWGLVLTLGIAACSSEDSTPDTSLDSNTMSKTISYDDYSTLLKNYVDDQGRVDYKGLQADRAALDAFVASLGAVDPDSYDGWSTETKMALWINAYNAITLKAIIDHYPIEKGGLINSIRYPKNSIRQIDGVWKKHTTRVAGRTVTLDAIEHDILRKEFEDPRIHVAIVCASVSCPPLLDEAFVAERLNAQLDDQSVQFFAGKKWFRIDSDKNKVYLSAILDWFDEDFVGHYNAGNTISDHGKKKGAILDFARTYAHDHQAEYLTTATYKVSFLDYDWSLNEQP
ncbi:MAG: DUF547 domain-containing protein [Candidatus Hydrogenedentota bacterium]